MFVQWPRNGYTCDKSPEFLNWSDQCEMYHGGTQMKKSDEAHILYYSISLFSVISESGDGGWLLTLKS